MLENITNCDTLLPKLSKLLGTDWAIDAVDDGKWRCSAENAPIVFIVVLQDDGNFKTYNECCDDIYSPCGDAECMYNWMDSQLCAARRVDACFDKLNASRKSLNSALTPEAARRVKDVFKTAQDAVEMPKGFRYTAFRENKSENSVLSTLMYTSAKLQQTQWVMKSALMAQFEGEPVEGSRVGEIVDMDAWAFQPNYDPERSDSGKEDYVAKAEDKIYTFRPNMDSSSSPDKQAAYWLVGILSTMIDELLVSPPNRVYEYFLADGLLKKKNLAAMDPGGLIRLLNKGILNGPEVLKAKPSIWKKLLEKGFITGEQAYKSQPTQLGWLALHDYIPVERALKIDPSIEKLLIRYGKIGENSTPDDISTEPAALLQYVTDGVLTPQKAWSLNEDVLKPMVESKLINAYDAYKLDPSILNWMLENHYIGRAEATKLKPRIKQEMDRKGVAWEDLDAAATNASRHARKRKTNASWEDVEPSWHDTYPDWAYGNLDEEIPNTWELVGRKTGTSFMENGDVFNTWTISWYYDPETRKNVFVEGTEDPYNAKWVFDSTDDREAEKAWADWSEVEGEVIKTYTRNGLGQLTEDLSSSRETWKYVKSKEVYDPEGWTTTYTWFSNEDGTRHIFMLDYDDPEPDYADWECDSWEEAKEWFDNYDNDEDLDSSKKLNCSADDTFYVSVDMGALILRVYKTAHGEWTEEVVYRDEEAAPYFVPSSYMGYLGPKDILTYIKNDFYGSEVAIVSEEEVDSFLGYDEDEWGEEDFDSSKDLDTGNGHEVGGSPYSNLRIEKSYAGTYVVRGDSDRFGKDAILYESYKKSDCDKWVKTNSSNINAARKPVDRVAVENQIRAKATEVMTGPDFGYEPSEIPGLLVVESKDTEDGFKIQVRAEATYEGLMNLCHALNPIVAKYDRYSYFEPVTSGIIDAYIELH